MSVFTQWDRLAELIGQAAFEVNVLKGRTDIADDECKSGCVLQKRVDQTIQIFLCGWNDRVLEKYFR